MTTSVEPQPEWETNESVLGVGGGGLGWSGAPRCFPSLLGQSSGGIPETRTPAYI